MVRIFGFGVEMGFYCIDMVTDSVVAARFLV